MQSNRIVDLKVSGKDISPVTRAQAKAHMFITHTDDDDYIDTLLEQCTSAIENYTGVPLREQTINYTFDYYEEEELPFGIVDTITEVKVRTGTASNGAAEFDTLTGDDFRTDGLEFITFCSTRYGRHYLEYDVVAPSEFTDLKLAILNEIAYRFEKRGDESSEFIGQEMGICKSARVLAMPYRRLNRL